MILVAIGLEREEGWKEIGERGEKSIQPERKCEVIICSFEHSRESERKKVSGHDS